MSMSGIVPAEATFKVGGLPVSIDSVRRIYRITPQNGTSGYEPNINGVIRLELGPSLGFLDTHNSFLSFRIHTKDGTVNHTKECRMDMNSMSWVRTFTVYSSTGAQLEQIDHYNLLTNLLHKATSPDDYRGSIAKMLDGGGDRASRNGAMSHPKGSQFCSGFDCSGILGGTTPYLPLGFCQGPIRIELTLAPFVDCFVGTAATGQQPSYVIDNVEYHASCISFGQDYNQQFERQLRNQGIDISYASYRTHNTTLTTDSVELQISQNAKSVKGVYQVLRSKSKYQSAEHDSLTTYKSGNLNELQWTLGGREFPEAPIKLSNDGVSQLYAHNLNAFNMFRNHALGSSISEEHFNTTESTVEPRGNITGASSYKALPIHRVYGTWCASHASVALFPSNADGAGQDTYFHVPTLSFVPTNARDLGLIQQGLRCKMGVSADIVGEATAAGNFELVKDAADGTFKNIITNLSGAAGTANAAAAATTKVGLDRFFKAEPAVNYGYLASKGSNYKEKSPNVLYSGSPCMVQCGVMGRAANTSEKILAGVGIPFVDGENKPVFCRTAHNLIVAGWCDILPTDEDFFIGNSFETHHENSRLISGADLTNAVPLHCRLQYSTGSNDTSANFFEYREDGDPFTSFVHFDAVLRIEPDGNIISSM